MYAPYCMCPHHGAGLFPESNLLLAVACVNWGLCGVLRATFVLTPPCNCCAAEGDRNALGTAMRVWTERQIELRGAYCINLTSTALALMLSSRHPALDEIQVRLEHLRHVLPW